VKSHANWFKPNLHLKTVFGNNGKIVNALPVASRMALRIAGAIPIIAASPVPAEEGLYD
jgi:hypothetical protein